MQEVATIMYYDRFLQWVDDHYTLALEDAAFYLLLFDPKIKEWFHYGDGYYQHLEVQEVRKIYLDCMKYYEIPTTSPKMNHCIQYLETICLFIDRWDDANPQYDCVKNGIVNLVTRELLGHTPALKFKYQIDRNFDPYVDPVIPARFNECLKAIPNKQDRDNYLKFWLAVVHKIHDYEVFLMCYGVKWGGKSSNLNIFARMYGSQVIGKKPLQMIGKRFGLGSIYDKRLNIHADMPIVNIDPYTISQLKSLTGNDGDMDIELKGVNSFTYPISLFLAFGINQLMGFTQNAEKEIDSVMRRVVMVEFPDVQKVDAPFKNSLEDPAFLDQLYSWFVITQSVPLFEVEQQNSWVQRNKKKWLLNSDPILRILMDTYQYEEGESVHAYEVVVRVKNELEQSGSLVPKSLKTQVTNALSTMGIYPNGRRGASANYENMSEMGQYGIEKVDLDFLLKGEQ